MTKNLYVSEGHFMFWPCKCGHVFGRHGGELFSGRMFGCFECKCKKFFPAQSIEKWRESLKNPNPDMQGLDSLHYDYIKRLPNKNLKGSLPQNI